MIWGRGWAPIALVKISAAKGERPATRFEDLSKAAQDALRALTRSLDPLGKLSARRRRGRSDAPANSRGRRASRDLRLPKPGDVLSRRYKGEDLIVRVLEAGFEFEGRRYRSLSGVAKAVTGAHWNGLLFFGIVRQER